VCRRLLPNGSRLAGYPLALDLSTVLEVLHRLDKADLLEMLEGAENRHLKYLLNRSAISASLGRSSACMTPNSQRYTFGVDPQLLIRSALRAKVTLYRPVGPHIPRIVGVHSQSCGACGWRRTPLGTLLRFPAHKLAAISTNTSANQGNSSSPRTEHRFLVAGARKYICIIWRNRFRQIGKPAHFDAVIPARICAPHPGSTERNTSERPSLKTASAKQKTCVRTGNIHIPASHAKAQTHRNGKYLRAYLQCPVAFVRVPFPCSLTTTFAPRLTREFVGAH
jgi:hypothetical protein